MICVLVDGILCEVERTAN
uniref:Uncharacterized protein n=1 Tax=Arundo donax TaxID=35708 RepID=A0A0A9B1D5_ARUDO